MNPTGDPTLDRWPSKVSETECSEGEEWSKGIHRRGNLEADERKCNKSKRCSSLRIAILIIIADERDRGRYAKLVASKFVEAKYIYIHIHIYTRWSLLEGKVTVRIKLNVSVTA